MCIRRVVICCFLSLVEGSGFSATNTFIYPISLHFFKGAYYIGDRAREAVLSYKNLALTTLYQTQDNTKLDLPLGLSDDGNNSIIVADPGVCALSKIDVSSGVISVFSRPSGSSSGLCPRFVTKYSNGLYAILKQDGSSSPVALCKGENLKFPY